MPCRYIIYNKIIGVCGMCIYSVINTQDEKIYRNTAGNVYIYMLAYAHSHQYYICCMYRNGSWSCFKKNQQLTFCFWAYTETIFLKTKIFILQLSLLSVLYWASCIIDSRISSTWSFRLVFFSQKKDHPRAHRIERKNEF